MFCNIEMGAPCQQLHQKFAFIGFPISWCLIKSKIRDVVVGKSNHKIKIRVLSYNTIIWWARSRFVFVLQVCAYCVVFIDPFFQSLFDYIFFLYLKNYVFCLSLHVIDYNFSFHLTQDLTLYIVKKSKGTQKTPEFDAT